jgi:molybdate transport system substrate-binding protein
MVAASARDLSVFTSGAPSAVQKALAPRFTEVTGHRVAITAATLNQILKELAGDTRPDVVVLPRPAMERLNKDDALRAGSLFDLARVGIGVAVREGAPLPDVSSPEALRRTLLNAKSIAHPDPKGGGFTGAHIDRIFDKLGIGDVVRPKVVLMFAFAGGVASIAKGEAEIGLFNISEIVPVPGVQLVGPLPAQLQSYITPAARDAWAKGGMEALVGTK